MRRLPPQQGNPSTGHEPGHSRPRGLIGLSWLASLLRIDAFVSPSGTGLIYTTGTSRVSYGLSRNRYFPQIFGKVDKNGVPWVD